MIKPAELIDISGASSLTLRARQIYNTLVANAFGEDMGKPGHVFTIPLSELRGSQHSNERIEDSILALMRTVVTVRLADGTTRRAQLLGGNDLKDTDRDRGTLTYSFDWRMAEMLQNSTVFGKLEVQVMMSFTTKYGLALYEAIARRVRLKHRFHEEWSLNELRDVLGVPEGRLTTYGNLNQYALKPAVAEVNAMAAFGVSYLPLKEGRKVMGIKIGWWLKDLEGVKAAFAEVNRTRIGRKARAMGTVEPIAD
jgi:hypothetical protein